MMDDKVYIPPPSDAKPNQKRWGLWMLGGCLFLLLCMGCIGLIGFGGGYYAYTQIKEEIAANLAVTETAITVENTPLSRTGDTAVPPLATLPPIEKSLPEATTGVPPQTTPAGSATAVVALDLPVPASIVQIPVPDPAEHDLQQLYITDFPVHDYFDTAVRLAAYNGPRTVTAPVYQLGDTHSFYNDESEIEAELLAVTEHTYFWVEEGVNLDQTDIVAAANQFETEYYAPLTNLFGLPWQPGVDNDPRFSVLHIGSSAADELGYFRGEDEYPQSLFDYSNEQEIIYLNMGELELGDDLYYATLVHEVQHLIQWNVDPSEAAWMNEGLSQLAEIYLGFSNTADTIDYLENPQTRLNTWAYDDDSVYAHYAGAYLFLVYVWEQLGDTAVQELVRHPANGLAGVYAVLEGFAPDVSLEQFTANWAVANYLDNGVNNDTDVDGRYYYSHLDLRRPSLHNKAERNQQFDVVDSLEQFGVHYINLNELRGPATISFAGDTAVPLIDAGLSQQTDNLFWYAPAVDEMDARLTGQYDLSGIDQATLTYSTWYDLEEGYDYAYLSISTDGGQTWQVLTPEHSNDGPFGDGYNGHSTDSSDAQNGWLKESISLDAYTGQPVQLRIDVITDSGITGQGFAIDDIAVTGYEVASFTDGPENWQAEGFVLTAGWLPQNWSVLLLEEKVENESGPRITPLVLDDLNRGQLDVNIGKGGGVLVIIPQTAFAQKEASYWLNVTPSGQ